jgi:hypothetical protein
MQHSTTQPRIAAITHQPVLKKDIFVFALAVFGFFSILSGIVGFVLAIILLSNATAPDLATTLFIDPAYDLTLGAIIIVSSRAFARGKFLSVWLYGGSLIIDSLYHTLRGYPLNFLFMGFGLLIIWQLLRFRSELDLR